MKKKVSCCIFILILLFSCTAFADDIVAFTPRVVNQIDFTDLNDNTDSQALFCLLLITECASDYSNIDLQIKKFDYNLYTTLKFSIWNNNTYSCSFKYGTSYYILLISDDVVIAMTFDNKSDYESYLDGAVKTNPITLTDIANVLPTINELAKIISE